MKDSARPRVSNRSEAASRPQRNFLIPEPLSEQETSRAIACARVILLSTLVFVHYIDYPFGTMLADADKLFHSFPVTTFISRLLGMLNTGLIVLLSTISGWLFFRLPKDKDWLKLRQKMVRRLRSLVTPLLFWCGLYLVLLKAVAYFDPQNPLPGGFNFDVVHPTWRDYMDALFGVTAYPIDYPFWFIRDLLVSVALSPILWVALKRAPYSWAIFFAVIWITNANFRIFYKPDVLCFFYLGGLLQVKKLPLGLGGRLTAILAALVVGFAAFRALAPVLVPNAHFDHVPFSLLLRIFRPVGLFAAWGVAIRIARTPVSVFIARLGGLSIFFFGAHAIILAVVKLVLSHYLPAGTDGWQFAHYALSVGLSLLLTYAIGAFIAKLSPSFFDFITGGRSDQNLVLHPKPGPEPLASAAPGVPLAAESSAKV